MTWNYLRVRGEYQAAMRNAEANVELPPRARRIQPSRSIWSEEYWNYLRVRGEYHQGRASPQNRSELPPRARRIPWSHGEIADEAGTTSACAENTPDWCRFPPCRWNYLRVRGEYRGNPTDFQIGWELPPRARRILAVLLPCAIPKGTTSACAENTEPASQLREAIRNYLRVRGEYLNINESNKIV